MKAKNPNPKDTNQDKNDDISSSEKVAVENVERYERDGEIEEIFVNREERNGENTDVEARINVQCGKHVAVRYNEEWHVGKIVQVDQDDNECLVTFMLPSQGKNTGNQVYKWPSTADDLWVKPADLLCELTEPEKVGMSGRSYAIRPDEFELASRLMIATLTNE